MGKWGRGGGLNPSTNFDKILQDKSNYINKGVVVFFIFSLDLLSKYQILAD